MTNLGTSIVFSALLCSHVANAQAILDEPRYTFDIATITCKQFMDVQTDGNTASHHLLARWILPGQL
jgi:hypothetical protein